MKLNNQGFSLIETLTMMIIFSLLIVIMIPIIHRVKDQSKWLNNDYECLSKYMMIDKLLDDLYTVEYPSLLIDEDTFHLINYQYDVELKKEHHLKINDLVFDAIIKDIIFNDHYISLIIQINNKTYNYILQGAKDEIHHN